MRNKRILSLAALIAAVIIPIEAAAADPAPSDVDALRQELNALQLEQRATDKKIDDLEQRINKLDGNTALSSVSRVSDSSAATMRGRGVGSDIDVDTSAQSTDTGSSDDQTRKTPAKSEAVEAVTDNQQGYFGHSFSIDPGFSYSHFSTAQLNLNGFLALDSIFLGTISLDQTDADVATTDVTARYGVGRFQADVNVPYLYRQSTFRSGGAGGNASGLIEGTVKGSGLGDVSAGLSYQLVKETTTTPDIVISVRAKAPTGINPFGVGLITVPGSQGNLMIPSRLSTGTGVWGFSEGISVLKTIDPMVVFGSFTYFHNFEKHFPDIDEAQGNQPGSADLGDAFQYGFGVAFALNDRSSLDMSFTERFVRRSWLKLDPISPSTTSIWQPVIGSEANVGVLNLGATFSLSNRLTLLTNLGVGITQDAPDMSLTVRLPYQF